MRSAASLPNRPTKFGISTTVALAALNEDAYWIARGVANLRNFQSKVNRIDLGDGVTIRGRSKTDLASLGFEEPVWERITEDWRTPGASSFVLVAEHCFMKQPDNLISNEYNPSLKATRAIRAL